MNSNNPSFQEYAEGRDFLAAGDLDAAIERLSASAVRSPHHKTYELLGEAYAKKEKYPDSILYLSAATTLNSGVRAPSLLAEVLLKVGRVEDARKIAELALSRDPSNKKAKSVFETAVRNPENA